MEQAVFQSELPIGDAAEAGIVRGQDHGGIVLPDGLPQELADDLGGVGIELRCRLVGQQHVGRADQPASNGNPLFFAAAEVPGELLGFRGDAQAVEQSPGSAARWIGCRRNRWARATLS